MSRTAGPEQVNNSTQLQHRKEEGHRELFSAQTNKKNRTASNPCKRRNYTVTKAQSTRSGQASRERGELYFVHVTEFRKKLLGAGTFKRKNATKAGSSSGQHAKRVGKKKYTKNRQLRLNALVMKQHTTCTYVLLYKTSRKYDQISATVVPGPVTGKKKKKTTKYGGYSKSSRLHRH